MRNERGFTLLELLLGMVLMGILMGLLGMWLQRWRTIELSLEQQTRMLAPEALEVERRVRLRQTVLDSLEGGGVVAWTREHQLRKVEYVRDTLSAVP